MTDKENEVSSGTMSTFVGAGALGTNTASHEGDILRLNNSLASHYIYKSIDISIHDSSKLDGASKYPVWSYMMQCIFEQHKLWTYST